jgi:hypothetical protein
LGGKWKATQDLSSDHLREGTEFLERYEAERVPLNLPLKSEMNLHMVPRGRGPRGTSYEIKVFEGSLEDNIFDKRSDTAYSFNSSKDIMEDILLAPKLKEMRGRE